MRLLRLETIVVGTDLTATSDAAMHSATALARAAGSALHVAHVAPPDAGIIAMTGKRSEYLRELQAALQRIHVEQPHTPHILTGAAAPAVAALADRLRADVIVTGRHRGRASLPVERPLGGTAYAIITRALTPCLAILEPLRLPLRRVLVAIDCSDASRGAMLVGLSWASALREPGHQGMLTALHVHDDAGGSPEREQVKRTVDHELDVLRRSAGGWANVEVSGITVPGSDPVDVIARTAADLDADLIVVGTRGLRDGGGAVLGSVSAALLSRVAAPVLLVPPAVWRDHTRDMDYL